MWRRIVTVVAAATMIAGIRAEDDRFLGTWELNLATSAITRGTPPKRETIANVAEPGGFRSAVTTETARGTNVEIHHYVFDGAFHRTEGSDPRELSFARVDTNTIDSDTRRNGAITVRRRMVLSADGQTMTVTASGVSGGGQAYTNDLRVYNRQSPH